MSSKLDEQILVVPTSLVVPDPGWRGVRPVDTPAFTELIRDRGEFRRRGDMEPDPSFKQIIPYLIFRHRERYFSGVRRSTTTEGRLSQLRWLGVGGHLNAADCRTGEILDWAEREWTEEVEFDGQIVRRTVLGLLNDDTNEVGRVHIGLVVILDGDSPAIRLVQGENNERGELLTPTELADREHEMETWASLCLQAIQSLP